jgi:prepilin-type N-terminal cleavage/methylation domain-containing protein
MIFHRLGLINKNQLGFTLTEVILAIAIAGIITGGITTTIFSVVTGSARTSNHMTAVRQVQNAGYWVSHDAQMAQPNSIDDNPSGGEFLVLGWTDWANDDHQVVYSLLADNKLQRSHSINDGTAETAIIAEYINPAMTSCVFTDTNDDDIDDTLIFEVTATVQQQTETRVYEAVPRPD